MSIAFENRGENTIAKSNELVKFSAPENPHRVVEILRVSGKIPIEKNLKILFNLIILTEYLIITFVIIYEKFLNKKLWINDKGYTFINI